MNSRETVMKRKIYEQLKASYPDKIISPFTFRSELPLSNSGQVYNFPLLKEDGDSKRLVVENRINKNDMLFVTAMGIYMYKRVVGKESKGVLQTYPDALEFPAVAGQFDPTDLEVIYNGRITFTANSKKLIKDLSARNFRYVPQTQKSANTQPQKDFMAGMLELSQFLQLKGTETNEMQLVIDSFTGMKIQDENNLANFENRVVLICDGFVIENVSNR
jgi:hypothetical protein